jgi:Icc protein
MHKRLVWVTDPHLNHVALPAWQRWIDKISSCAGDALLITGDISEGDDVVFQLRRVAEAVELPIYLVLGNHDFYQSSIGKTRAEVIAACREDPRLHYLTDCRPVTLAGGVYLVGDDGWGDATIGDYEHSPIRLNDFALIEDFSQSDPANWKSMLIEQGTASGQRLAEKLASLPADAKQVLIPTHVPPFRESCWYEGQTTDDNWAPFFVCGRVGDALSNAATSRPNVKFTVLCGHTHNEGVAQMRDNLIVYTGAAQYGAPDVEATIEVASVSVTPV